MWVKVHTPQKILMFGCFLHLKILQIINLTHVKMLCLQSVCVYFQLRVYVGFMWRPCAHVFCTFCTLAYRAENTPPLCLGWRFIGSAASLSLEAWKDNCTVESVFKFLIRFDWRDLTFNWSSTFLPFGLVSGCLLYTSSRIKSGLLGHFPPLSRFTLLCELSGRLLTVGGQTV